MVSVCSGCNVLHPLTAGLLGIIAGSLYLVSSATMIKIQVDDPVDAVAVHAGSGFLSIILTPLFRCVSHFTPSDSSAEAIGVLDLTGSSIRAGHRRASTSSHGMPSPLESSSAITP